MSTSIHRESVVGLDGKIELTVPELQPGQRVSITIESSPAPSPAPADAIHIIDLIKDLPGHRLFKTAQDVDDYLRQERASWDH